MLRETVECFHNDDRQQLAVVSPGYFEALGTRYLTFRWQPGFEFYPQDCVLEAEVR